MEKVNMLGMGGGNYIDVGDHLVHIFDVKDNTRSTTPGIDIVFKNDAGQTIRDTFWLTEKALPRLARLAIASGCASGPKDPVMESFHPEQLQGRAVMIKVAKETSERDGKTYSVVKTFWKPDNAPAAQAPTQMREPGEDNEGFEVYDREDPFK